ncbi:NAD-binding protein [Natrinema halophilum]|uniref:NAD-binding protein n=1 Tax=Natrinema halophilum TaxID=1699371 RepID=A0A7D5KS07_9EURY|nr:NAD-binding protein [Natrinema halophilum]QLG49857.1 NAD-binding protein [Natrinema halophilum]
MADSRIASNGHIDLAPRRIHVVGDDGVGVFLASELSTYVHTSFVGVDETATASAARAGLETSQIDVTDLRSFAFATFSDGDTVIVASSVDARNFLLAQTIKMTTGVDEIIVRLANPHNASAFEEIDVETVCIASMLTTEVLDRLTS